MPPKRGGRGGGGGGGRGGGGGGGGGRNNNNDSAAAPAASAAAAAATSAGDSAAAGVKFNMDVFEDTCKVGDRRVKARVYHIPNAVVAATGGGAAQKTSTSLLIAERRIQGIDDPVYEKNLRTVWENLPRGQARVYELAPDAVVPKTSNSGASNQQQDDEPAAAAAPAADGAAAAAATPAPAAPPIPGATLVGEVYGMRKFGYRESGYGYRSKIATTVCIEKVNGECAHISGCVVNGVPCWIAGSKHVHIVVPDEIMAATGGESSSPSPALHPFLKGCYSEERFVYANKIAGLLSIMLRNVFGAASAQPAPAAADTDGAASAASKTQTGTSGRLALLRALATKRWTANAEAIFSDAEHLVDYDGANELRFFAVSFRGKTTDGLCLPPEQAFEFFKSFGLPTAKAMPRVKYESDAYKEQIDKVAKSSNFEGVVVYGSDEAGKVVCVWKEKSYPYVMDRIAREAITGRHMTGALLQAYLMKRLNEQAPALRQYFAQWEQVRLPMLVEFATYLVGRGLLLESDRNKRGGGGGRGGGAADASTGAAPSFGVRSAWLTLQKEFEKTPAEERALLKQRADVLLRKAPPADRDVVMFISPPGGGKSTLARGLQHLLTKNHGFPRTVWINQDELGGKRAAYVAAVKDAAADKTVTHIILDKCNMELQNRSDVEEAMGGCGPTVAFVMTHPEGAEELANVCIGRVTSRGKNHKSLTIESSADVKTVERVVYSMLENYDAVASGAGATDTIKIDVTATPEAQLRTVWEGLKRTSSKQLGDATPEQIAEAVRTAKAYELTLKK